MIKSLTFSALMCLSAVTGFCQIWTENFDAQPDGAVSGTATGTVGGPWSVLTTPAGGLASFSKQTHTGLEIFQVNNTGTEGVWHTDPINIAALGQVALELNIYTAGASATDYVRAYYKLDGGPEILFGQMAGAFFSFSQPASAIVSGNTLEIVVRANENTAGTIPFIGGERAMGFENVSIVDISTLYSRKTGTWDDNTAGNATWSAVALGGASCNCIPTDDTHVVIGNGNTVTIDAPADAIDITVLTTGILQWGADEDLVLARDGDVTVDAGGTISANGFAGAQIVINNTNGHNIVANGSLTISNINVDAASAVELSGGGTFTINNNLSIATGASITSNKATSQLSINNRISFNGNNAILTNNQQLAVNTLYFNGDNNAFTNNGTATISVLLLVNDTGDDGNFLTNNIAGIVNIPGIDLNTGDFIFNNSGTINQSGTFTDITTGSAFNNLATGTWNWSLTPNTGYDADVNTILDCTQSGNIFNYNGNGAQTIIPTSYHHLTLSVAGAKNSNNAAISVGGNWTVSGTATFTEGTGTVTLNGSGGQTIANPAGETFNRLVINNTSAAASQVILNNNVTVSTNLTMTNGDVNLNGNTLTISSAVAGALTHSLASSAGWMYGGNLTRAIPTTAITVGTADGFFPLGGTSDYRPFFIGKTNNVSSGGTITVSHTDATSATNVSFLDGGVTIQRRHDSFWSVSKTGVAGAGTFNITAGGTGYIIGAVNHTRLTRASDATAIGTAGASTGTTADVRVHRTGLVAANLVNNFYVASSNAALTPLPIELDFFRARLQQDEVVLTWKTLQERNNHFFTIQRTTDFETFYEVAKIDGQGDSSEEKVYTAVDQSPFSGKSYYRLKQTDFDGKFTYSEPVMIEYNGTVGAFIKAFPNPFSGEIITVELKGMHHAGVVPLLIYNQTGEKVFEILLHERETGNYQGELSFSRKLPPGFYILKAGRILQLTSKVIVR